MYPVMATSLAVKNSIDWRKIPVEILEAFRLGLISCSTVSTSSLSKTIRSPFFPSREESFIVKCHMKQIPKIQSNEQKKDEKNIFLHVNEKNVSSGEIQEKMCQQIAESRIQPDCLLVSSDVFSTPILSSDAIVNTDEQNSADNQGLASLLRRALNKLANSQEYNGIVEDIHAFVNAFNERIPEYKMRFGQQMVLDNAKKLKARGWK